MKFDGFHPEASDEVVAIKRWYMDQSEAAATRFDEEVQRSIQTICEDPLVWRERIPGVRQYAMHRFPFYVVYRIKTDVIEVLAIAHARRRPGYWKSRIEV
jgi:plasmid stabilization system protein ParE